MTLQDLPVGSSGVITAVGGEGSLRQHFLDMGVIPGAEVTLIQYAPMGDPMELRIHGYELTLRRADGEKVTVTPLPKDRAPAPPPAEETLSPEAALAVLYNKTVPAGVREYLDLRSGKTPPAVKPKRAKPLPSSAVGASEGE